MQKTRTASPSITAASHRLRSEAVVCWSMNDCHHNEEQARVTDVFTFKGNEIRRVESYVVPRGLVGALTQQAEPPGSALRAGFLGVRTFLSGREASAASAVGQYS